MLEARWRTNAAPHSRVRLGDPPHRSGLLDVGHGSRILNWTHGHSGEGKPIRGHAVHQQLGTAVVLTVVETESTIGREARQERTIDPRLRLAGVENVHGVFLVGS